MMKLTGLRICVLSAMLTIATMKAAAYDEVVHQVISDHAAKQSALYTSPSLLADWGYGDPQTTTFPSYDFSSRTIAGMVGQGAFHEDNLAQIKRVFNHFTDAQFNSPFGLGLQGPAVGTVGHPSPIWALEDLATVSSISVPLASPGVIPQMYSYRDAQEHFFQALTNANPETRLTEFGTVFQTLGHVVHHIQDMGQPQHTRNESHISEGLFTDIAGSWYERYTSLRFPREDPLVLQNFLSSTSYNGGVIPSFSTAREFWSQPSIPGPRFRGMADFTARNYVGLATNFRVNVAGNGTVTLLGDPDQPLPNGTNRDGSQMYVQRVTAPLTLLNGTVRNTSMRYVKGAVYDEYTGQTQERILASESIFVPAFGGAGPLAATMATNSVVFDDNYHVLLPRASAFSTGLINHFFRGRLSLARTTPNGNDWTITNVGSQHMNGEFSLYREDSSGTRTLAGGPWTRSVLAGTGTVVGISEPPSSTSRMVAVFRGQIGAEGSLSSGFYAVAGKVVDYGRPAIPCTSAPGSTGWSYLNLWGDGRGINNGGTENPGLLELGSTAGTVRGEFNSRWSAGSTRWSITVRRGGASGSVVYSSGFFSGLKDFSFNHAGGYEDSQRKVHVRVAPEISPNFTDSNSWSIQFLCPGMTFSDANRVQQRVTLHLSVWVSAGFCQTGHVDFFVDDNPAGRAYLPDGGSNGAYASVFPSVSRVMPGSHHLRAVMTSTNNFGCGGLTNVGWEGPDGVRRTFTPSGQNIDLQE